MTTKTSAEPVWRGANFFGNLFMCIYVVLFLPALVYLPILGGCTALAADLPGVEILLSILLVTTVPLSMPFSLYFICARSLERRYGKMVFFCLLPLICFLSALVVISLFIWLR